MTRVGSQRHRKKNYCTVRLNCCCLCYTLVESKLHSSLTLIASFILWRYVKHNFALYDIIKYIHCKVIGHGNVYRDVIVNIRTYADKVLHTQNYSYNNTLKFGTPYTEHPVYVAGKKETLEFYKNVTSRLSLKRRLI